MINIIKFLDELNDDELYAFEKDIKNGTVQKFIEQKKEYFRIKDKTCSVCGNNVNEDCLVLIFGDPRSELRRKAHFCGTDCMEYFVNKNIRKDKDAKKPEKKA
jgi:hypothetical protein